MRERGIKIHLTAIGINPDADNRARAVLAGWARDNTGANGGSNGPSPQAAELQKEINELSRALDTFDSKVLARFGGFTRAGARYRSLRGMQANPAAAAIRIDTFEVWRSWRIYPGGVSSTRLRNEIELCGFFQRVSAPIRPSNSGHHLSKIGHPLRRPQSRASVRQTERVLLRTTFAQTSRSHIPHIHLWLDHCAPPGSEPSQRGSKWRERPPRLRIPLGSGPPWLCASRGSGASLPTGGSLPP